MEEKMRRGEVTDMLGHVRFEGAAGVATKELEGWPCDKCKVVHNLRSMIAVCMKAPGCPFKVYKEEHVRRIVDADSKFCGIFTKTTKPGHSCGSGLAQESQGSSQ